MIDMVLFHETWHFARNFAIITNSEIIIWILASRERVEITGVIGPSVRNLYEKKRKGNCAGHGDWLTS